jgi:hypothetical protein
MALNTASKVILLPFTVTEKSLRSMGYSFCDASTYPFVLENMHAKTVVFGFVEKLVYDAAAFEGDFKLAGVAAHDDGNVFSFEVQGLGYRVQVSRMPSPDGSGILFCASLAQKRYSVQQD